MNHCLTCKVQLDQPGLVETADCGGDCLECMGRAGDPAAAEAFLKEIKALRAALQMADELCKCALPKFNWGASALDARAIQLLNETPRAISQALKEKQA